MSSLRNGNYLCFFFLLPLLEEYGWKPLHIDSNTGIVEDEGSTFRGAEVREARGSLELDKGAPQGRQPRSRLACPLVLQQRAFSLVRGGFVQSVQTGIWKNTLKSSGVAGDKHAGPDRPAPVCCPGTVPWVCVEVPHPQLIFHPVKYNTHTHCVNTVFLATDPAG